MKEFCPFCKRYKIVLIDQNYCDRFIRERYFVAKCSYCRAQGPRTDSADEALSQWREVAAVIEQTERVALFGGSSQ